MSSGSVFSGMGGGQEGAHQKHAFSSEYESASGSLAERFQATQDAYQPYGNAAEQWASASGYTGPVEAYWGEPTQSARNGPPLRAVSVGPSLVRAGAELWLFSFSRFVNPNRVRLQRAILTNPKWVDPQCVAELPVPVEIGQSESVQRAARECDVMLCWGLGIDEFLDGVRPKLCVFVAHGEGPWTKAKLQASSRSVDHVVAVSERTRRLACDGIPATVIHNGIDTSRLGQTRSRCAVREALGFSPGDFVLGYVGRFSSEKCVSRLVHATAELPRNFKLLLVGWAADRRLLMDQANDRIPGRYAFARADHYLGDYYHAMDAFCLVSHEEGFSLALLEAMMCARPVIVTPVGSAPEIIEDRVNGILVDGSPASIADAARRLHQHPHWADALAREGRAYAEENGHALRMTRQYEDLLESLWQQKHGQRLQLA